MNRLPLILFPPIIGGIVLFLIDYFVFSEVNWQRNIVIIIVMAVINAFVVNKAKRQ